MEMGWYDLQQAGGRAAQVVGGGLLGRALACTVKVPEVKRSEVGAAAGAQSFFSMNPV